MQVTWKTPEVVVPPPPAETRMERKPMDSASPKPTSTPTPFQGDGFEAVRRPVLDLSGGAQPMAVPAMANTASKVETSRAWYLLQQGYRQSHTLGGALRHAFEAAAQENPFLQAELISLLQATSTPQLEGMLNADWMYKTQGAGLPPQLRGPAPAGIHSVGPERVSGSALEMAASSVPADQLRPALDAAVKHGHLQAVDRDVMARYVGPAGAVLDARVDAAMAEVQQAQQAYTRALEERTKLDEQLASDLASLGPYLTEEQKARYVEEYKDLHAARYRDLNALADPLKDALARNADTLDLALRGPDATRHAQVMVDAYEALAQSPHAEIAMKWANEADAPGSPFKPFVSSQRLSTVLEHAVSNELADIIAKNPNKTPEEAVGQLEQILKSLGTGHAFGEARMDLAELPQATREGLKALRQLARGEVKEAMHTMRSIPEGSSKWTRPFATAGFLIGAVQAFSANANGKKLEAWSAGMTTAEQALIALSSLNKTGGAKLAGRIAPGFGAMASLLDFVGQVDDLKQGKANTGTKIAMAGNLAGIVGNGLLLAGTMGVGAVISGISTALVMYGEYKSQKIEEEKLEQLRRDQQAILERLGADGGTITQLAQAISPQQAEELMARTGWTRDQVIELGATVPSLFKDLQGHLPQLVKVWDTFGLDPAQRREMLDALVDAGSSNQSDKRRMLDLFSAAVSQFPSTQDAGNRELWRDHLSRLGSWLGARDGQGLRNAARYLSEQ